MKGLEDGGGEACQIYQIQCDNVIMHYAVLEILFTTNYKVI